MGDVQILNLVSHFLNVPLDYRDHGSWKILLICLIGERSGLVVAPVLPAKIWAFMLL